MNVHLVDGTFELFRAFYGGAPKSTDRNGVEVGGTRAFLRSMFALLGQDDVTHIAVAFDSEVESFRNEMFDGYKAGEGIDPELFAQFPFVEEAAEALGMTVWRMREFEADDALATAALRFAKEREVTRVVLCSPDKDLAQCISGDRIVSFNRIQKALLNENGVREKFGVSPASMPDYLALVGDAADGIPGIPKWGAKSSGLVLSAYGSIDRIPPDPATWSVKVRGAAGLAQSLNERREEAALYKDLATLRTEVPLPETLADIRWRGARRDLLVPLCERLGENALPGRIPLWRDA